MCTILKLDGKRLGGGSLISLDIVLTAAHIVEYFRALTARCGDWKTGDLSPSKHQDRSVKCVQIYWPLSVKETNDYKKNWALLFTEDDFVPVLWVFHNLITNLTIKSEQEVLKAVNLTVVDERQCVAI